MKAIIKKKLSMKLSPIFLHVEDVSHFHRRSKKLNTHFNIIIVCKEFKNKSQIIRHQLIYQILSKEIRRDIHALSLYTYFDEEWKIDNKRISSTPICYNAS